MPTAPPSALSTSDSPNTMRITCRGRQPMARSTPNSRVRSKTLINMVFITPTPPMRMAIRDTDQVNAYTHWSMSCSRSKSDEVVAMTSENRCSMRWRSAECGRWS